MMLKSLQISGSYGGNDTIDVSQLYKSTIIVNDFYDDDR